MLKYYFAQDWEAPYFSVFERHARDCKDIVFDLLKLYAIFDREQLRGGLPGHRRQPALRRHRQRDRRPAARHGRPDEAPAFFSSDEAQLLRELREFGEEHDPALFTLDLIIIWKKKRKVIRFKDEAVALFRKSFARGGRVFFIGSGTSYHAALTAGYFFNNLTSPGHRPLQPRPVPLRLHEQPAARRRAGGHHPVGRDQGPGRYPEPGAGEVRATRCASSPWSTTRTRPSPRKRPTSSCRCSAARRSPSRPPSRSAPSWPCSTCWPPAWTSEAQPPQQKLEKIQHLIGYTLKACEEDVTAVMLKFFLKPSIHILGTSLIGLAREGALKIREVVLNHAEGYDAAEFKHGPNTILGKNTLYSFMDMENLLADMAEFCRDLLSAGGFPAAGGDEVASRFFNWVRDFKFSDFSAEIMDDPAGRRHARRPPQELYRRFREQVNAEKYFSNYPLIFVCPPDERDIRITISQIHTHKIRGADVVLIAEENAELAKALEGKPALGPGEGRRGRLFLQVHPDARAAATATCSSSRRPWCCSCWP